MTSPDPNNPTPDPAPRTEDAAPQDSPLFDNAYVSAMAHFYRGEMGRIMVWRSRLDATTTWAITTTTTIFTVAFSFSNVPHIIFFFNVCIVSIMLWIEARRYRFYDAYHARVRMLEAHFLVPIVMRNTRMLQGEWQMLVSEDLLLPSFKIGRLEAIGRRLKRNYTFIFMVILAAWVAKIFMHASQPITDFGSFYKALAVPGLASSAVATLFLLTIGAVVGLTIYIVRKGGSEVVEFGSRRKRWRI